MYTCNKQYAYTLNSEQREEEVLMMDETWPEAVHQQIPTKCEVERQVFYFQNQRPERD